MQFKWGIKLESYHEVMKKMIEQRLRKETQVTENQFDFLHGRLTMKARYLLRRMMKQYLIYEKDLHLVFIDLGQACDIVPSEILLKNLKNKGVGVAYI